MSLLLRDEVKAGDTELGCIITEVGVEARGVAEISTGVGGGLHEMKRGGLKTSRLPSGDEQRKKNKRQHRFPLKCWQGL